MPGGGWCSFIGDICYCDEIKYANECYYELNKQIADSELFAAQQLQRINDVERGWF